VFGAVVAEMITEMKIIKWKKNEKEQKRNGCSLFLSLSGFINN